MAAYFFAAIFTLTHCQQGSGTAVIELRDPSLQQGSASLAESGGLLLFLLVLIPLGRRLYHHLQARRLAARLAGRNHPAIPSIRYETPALPGQGNVTHPGPGQPAPTPAAAPQPEPAEEQKSAIAVAPEATASRVDAPGAAAPGVEIPLTAALVEEDAWDGDTALADYTAFRQLDQLDD